MPTHHPRPRPRPRHLWTLLLVTPLAACSLGTQQPQTADGEEGSSKTVVLATHDSFAVPKQTWRTFTEQTGYRVKVLASGDAGALTNKLVLTREKPIADAVFGIDNTFASRAVDEGVVAEYDGETSASASSYDLPDAEGAARLTPIDFGDVCVNVDDRWFARQRLAPPTTLDDLTKPAYRDLFVTPGAATSSPGLAFLLATIGEYGEEWPDYWRDLMANGAKITSGWSDAYEVDFTVSGGDRPIVLSYASSPPFTVDDSGRPTTSALLETCFRQVEYAGVLQGAANEEGAQALVDFMSGPEFQAILPESMYVFPVDESVDLPTEWARFAKVAPDPIEVDPADIAANRETWLREWEDVTTR